MIRILSYEPEATTLGERLARRRSLGSKPFLIIRDEVLTYGEADDRANEIGNRLLELGLRTGTSSRP